MARRIAVSFHPRSTRCRWSSRSSVSCSISAVLAVMGGTLVSSASRTGSLNTELDAIADRCSCLLSKKSLVRLSDRFATEEDGLGLQVQGLRGRQIT